MTPEQENTYRYIISTLHLHMLTVEGGGDSDRADRLRDIMDSQWYGMDSDGIELSKQVSELLHRYQDKDDYI